MSSKTLATLIPLRIASILLALTLTMTLTSLAAAKPAQAATAGNCQSGHSCIWRDQNYKTDGSNAKAGRIYGEMRVFRGDTYRFTNKSMHDSASSAANAGISCKFTWFEHENFRGKPFVLKTNRSEPSLASFGFNDMADSGRFCR